VIRASCAPPRSFAVNPKTFGKDDIQWRTVEDPLEQDLLLAAKIQHEYALKINRRVREVGITIKELAARGDTNSPRANGRMLRGEAYLRLEYLAQVHRILGDIL
jgi:hypothetical protein